MIRPRIQVKERNSGEMNRLLREFADLKKAKVTIGFHEDAGTYPDGQDVVEVALWMEFGFSNWMTGQKVGPRSFIRAAVDENIDKINTWREEALYDIVEKKVPVKTAMDKLGFNVMTLVQNKIKSNVPPPLADSTRQAKKREASTNWDRTLMDTETMLNAVGYKVST